MWKVIVCLFLLASPAYANEQKIETMYDLNGKLVSETPYVNGQIEGVMKLYYESEKLKAEIPYVKGKKEGVEKIYFKTGKLLSETPHANGQIEGVEKLYYESGKLIAEVSYVGNRKEGVEKWYNANEELVFTLINKNNSPISGNCAKGRKLTSDELEKLKKHQGAPQCH